MPEPGTKIKEASDSSDGEDPQPDKGTPCGRRGKKRCWPWRRKIFKRPATGGGGDHPVRKLSLKKKPTKAEYLGRRDVALDGDTATERGKGPGPPLRPTDFPPVGQTFDAATGAENLESQSGSGYPALPQELAGVSFDVSRGCCNMPLVRAALEEHGFICLRGFIPKMLVEKAFEESTTYFLGILRSFWGGMAIDEGLAGFDKLAKLPPMVWERRDIEKVTISFRPGEWGFQADPQTNIVNFVQDGGQAQLRGVKRGWVVLLQQDGIATLKRGDRTRTLTSKGGDGLLKGGDDIGMWRGEKSWGGSSPCKILFQAQEYYSTFAKDQKWGVCTQKGYFPKLGMGKCTEAVHLQSPATRDTQLWMRHFLATLHNCSPHELCWQPRGVSFKARRVFWGFGAICRRRVFGH